MAIRAKLTTPEERAARAAAAGTSPAAPESASKREFSEEERAKRKERVTRAKDALTRSVGTKGDHVAGARTALKNYLQRLNEPNQPDDAAFDALVEAPFKAPEKKKPLRR